MRRKLSRRVVVLLFLAAIAAVATRVAAPAPEHHIRFFSALACGIERWQIKTLQDRPRLLRPRLSTVADLVNLPRPSRILKRETA